MALIKKYYFLIFCVLALILPEALLMGLVSPGVFTEGYVAVVSKIFSLSWVCLIVIVCVFLLPKRFGRVLYILLSGFFIVLSFSEYIYYRLFDQFFWLKSILLAGEGTDYLDYVVKLIDGKLILFTLLAIFSLVFACIFWKAPARKRKIRFLLLLLPILALVGTHIYMQPELHHDATDQWDIWRKPRVVYQNFNDVNKCLEASGLYQFTYLNLYTALMPNHSYDEDSLVKADEYFALKEELPVNRYTGLFEGKNVIVVMMESMDTWMIDEKHTPTIDMMMKKGINFTNFNAPFFGTGFTLSSEFAFNTGFFTPVSAASASKFSTNSFPYAPARLFQEKGYRVNSFHFNDSEFYNRGILHRGFGYEKYHSAADFGISGVEAELDSNLMKSDEFYEKMTESTPFFNFVVTYSAHLPYMGESDKLILAKEYRPDLIDEGTHEEMNNIQILAADTDEFFRLLLERLREDGLMKDTVIVAYTDHFAYGVSDRALLDEWKGEALSYRVPAFIYAEGLKPVKVSKPMMTIDWAPTLVNLFGLSREGRYIGNDILDPKNSGFAYFETWGWLDDKMYYVPSEGASNAELSSEEALYIEKQNQRVRESIEINDAVVLGDYYKVRS